MHFQTNNPKRSLKVAIKDTHFARTNTINYPENVHKPKITANDIHFARNNTINYPEKRPQSQRYYQRHAFRQDYHNKLSRNRPQTKSHQPLRRKSKLIHLQTNAGDNTRNVQKVNVTRTILRHHWKRLPRGNTASAAFTRRDPIGCPLRASFRSSPAKPEIYAILDGHYFRGRSCVHKTNSVSETLRRYIRRGSRAHV